MLEIPDAKDTLAVTTSLEPLDAKAPNLSLEWKNWSLKFKIFMRASALESQSDARKVALLLHHIGSQSLHIVNSFNVNIDSIKYVELWQKLESYFVPKANIAMLRHKFFTRKQMSGENITQYATELQNLSIPCEF